ncbi:Citrate lyase alpha chain [Cupriavidus taiwanensis]|uniref:citrate lyase subunit alpha n=1 Tax=Cupriavidus taiwanensis TaxID=164546 RepID=UPI000E188ED5|nr:citrate lyase subunit alpha [Cupriavidus taiwanensis]SOY96436.1 Citrate lyase alpha chain [Cupriavidus taiwanensis]
MENSIGRIIPEWAGGYRLVPYTGVSISPEVHHRVGTSLRSFPRGTPKLLTSIRESLDAACLRDGSTISFHHHLRNGDAVANAVLREAASMGLRGLTVAASSIFPVHEPWVDLIESGVIRRIYTAYASGPVADAVTRGALQTPIVMHTHGGRARLIESGALTIDAAFVAAPTADACGNLNGVHGPSACGTLGYAEADVRYAATVIAVTDNLVPYPATSIAISQDCVDYVVAVPSIGDRSQIVSGTTRPTDEPAGLEIARLAAQVIEAAGVLDENFGFQTGAGGISLAVAAALREIMANRGITGSFAAGGITGYLVDMLEQGLFRSLLDVQCFDLRAVDSFRDNPRHSAMSASMYANPWNKGAVVNRLSAMILGAGEVDLDFNVNVTTASDGRIIGGSGGHSDTAAGAELAIVTTRLHAGRVPKVVESVRTVTTPGETIDVVVTEAGIAVNPLRVDVRERLVSAGLPVVSIEELFAKANEGLDRRHSFSTASDEVVGVVEYRDGTILDAIRRVEHP